MTASRIAAALSIPLLGLALVAQAAEPAPAKPADKAPAAAKAPAKAPAKGKAPAELPADVAEQMNKLVELAIQHAGVELQQGVDDFRPYGVMLTADGEYKHVHWQKAEPPPPLEILRGIVLTMRGQAARDKNVVAAVSVAPSAVPTSEGVDVRGIRCEVDHRRGEPKIVFIPYTRENGQVITGSMVYLPGSNAIFDRGAPASTPAAKPAAAKQPAAKPAAAAPAKPAAAKQ